MAKTQKELAYLRDISVTGDWTKRFIDLTNRHLAVKGVENLLYINAGTGGHALVLDEKYGEKIDIFAKCENEDLLNIARDKASALRSAVDFSTITFDDDAFDAVLLDASLVPPGEIAEAISDAVRVAKVGASVGTFLPTAGSFGEIFSLLWEASFELDLFERGLTVENLISKIPTPTRLESMAAKAGLVNLKTETANEVFEFETGAAFIASPLVTDYLMPSWLAGLDEDEAKQTTEKLVAMIDAEDGPLPFRFSVKATLLSGEKG